MSNTNVNTTIRTVTGIAYLSSNDNIIYADSSGGSVSIYLPALNTSGLFNQNQDFRITILDVSNTAGTNNITVFVSDVTNDQVNGATSVVMNTNGCSAELILTGKNDYALLITNSAAGGASSTIYEGYKTITSAELLALDTTAIQLVAAQGSGTVVKIISFVSKNVYNTIAYSSGAHVHYCYGATDTTKVAITTALFTSSTNKIYDGTGAGLTTLNTALSYANYENQALNLKASGAITTGNGTIRCYYQYVVMTI